MDSALCVSWSPGGLAFKLPDDEVENLLERGEAVPLKYFEKGHVKQGYAMFENPDDSSPSRWKEYFLSAMTYAALSRSA